MADYFAHDDALEPALAVLCEVLRNAPNIGTVLSNKCQTFLGLATDFKNCVPLKIMTLKNLIYLVNRPEKLP